MQHPLFVKYFIENYMQPAQRPGWVGYSRRFPHGSIDTTLPLETINRELKYTALQRRVGQRPGARREVKRVGCWLLVRNGPRY